MKKIIALLTIVAVMVSMLVLPTSAAEPENIMLKAVDVTYYNIGDYSSFPEAYSLTDKNITIGQCVLSLNQDGTLVVDQANGAWFGQNGLVFTFAD